MCQICSIKQIATQDRWPKPLESAVQDINFLVQTIHTDYEANKPHCTTKETIPEDFLENLRLLSLALEQLDRDREGWWYSPEKKEQRRRLEGEGQDRKLTELQKINNAAATMVEGMQAKLGGFVKWSLGMNGGIWELEEGGKVKKG
ncbi:hypothetical protein KC332_g3909 [Hortaea werneckii]|uniref:Uncharacterized protein n=2 Tax=Hortaea werneckii TaxID=91943 RepID=A0A3M7IL07_HORWE|nr:hypothetical protein KC358_g3845 [Hortaea werneckii]OTA28028.1 hypothetical protein BTJ68_09586 [Hortaea werneckii EXF-2000]KAI6848020.1 hypothetical protein KC350_g3183 [Hortaea werneckii]KAI6940236.1 hypothetical protein KC341_g3652 [Hortaea werneckii]KAI6944260.1 hypothetical protein KC348_g4019 [Hortaea werneckii]